jgi:hypothetical protein
MDVVGHDCEAVELETVFVAVLEEGGDEEFGVGCALEVAMSLEGQDRDCVGALLWRIVGIERKHTPGAKALFLPGSKGGPSLKAWLT